MLQRRQFLTVTAALLAARIVRAQQPQKVRKIGYLSSTIAGSSRQERRRQLFPPFLARAGYEEGRNLVIEWRFSDAKDGGLLRLAEELVRLNLELIVADGDEAIAAAKQATRTIPIVMLFGSHPVESGFVKSLARPGGNITGTIWSGPEQGGKVLEILKQAAPDAAQIAVIWNPAFPFNELWRAELARAAICSALNLRRSSLATRAMSVALKRAPRRQRRRRAVA